MAGTTLLVYDPGTATASPTLLALALPSGALLWATPLPLGALAPHVPDGSGHAYVPTGSSLLPVSITTGALQPPISLGSPLLPVRSLISHNGVIYAILGVQGTRTG